MSSGGIVPEREEQPFGEGVARSGVETEAAIATTPSGPRSGTVSSGGSKPVLYPVKGCGQCAEILAAHLLTSGVYEVMEKHLENHVSTPGRLWGTKP